MPLSLFVLLLFAAAAALALRFLIPFLLGESTLPALWKMWSHGCLSLSSPRLFPSPSARGLSLSLPPHLGDGGAGALFSAASASTATPLLAILMGRPFEVVLEGVQLAVGLDEATLEPHVYSLLAWAGLVRLPGGGGGGGGGAPTLPADPPPETEPPTPGASGDGCGLSPAGIDAAVAAVAAAAAAAPPPAPPSSPGGVALPKGLSLAPTTVVLNARIVAYTATITIADASLTVPRALVDIIGSHVTLAAGAGRSALEKEAGRLNLASLGWAAAAPPAASGTAPPTGRPLLPVAAHVEAEKGALSAAGWLTTTGLVLARPATAALDLTPALVKCVLCRLNPLLTGALRLAEDDAVRVSLAPAHMHIPCRTVDVRVDPLRLELAPTPLILGALRLVGGARAHLARGGGPLGGAPAAPGKQRSPFSSPRKQADESLALCGVKANGKPATRPPDALEAWTGPLAATLHMAGWVESGRLDMLASKNFAAGCGAAHLALWGSASLTRPPPGDRKAAARARWLVPVVWGRRGRKDGGVLPPPTTPAPPRPGRLDMTMAILSDSLGLVESAAAVVEGEDTESDGLPPPHPLPPAPSPPAARVSVRGSADSPDIAWVAATRDILAALVEAHAVPAGSRAAGWLSKRRAAREAAAGPPPPPVGALPWESRLQRAGASRRAAEAGAPPAATSAARLGRAIGTRLGQGKATTTTTLGTLRAPGRKGKDESGVPAPASWSRDAFVAPPLAK